MPSNGPLYGHCKRNPKPSAVMRHPAPEDGFATTGDVVYVMRWNAVPGINLVKIGHSSHGPLGRWGAHKNEHNHAGAELAVERDMLAVVAGNKTEEHKAQDYFAAHSWNGSKEIFHDGPEIAQWIRWLRDHWFVVTGDDEERDIRTLTGVETTSYSDWGPNPERRKGPPRSGPLFEYVDDKDSVDDGIWNLGKREIEDDGYYSPRELMDAVHAFWPEGITLDPASNPWANRVVQAEKIYGKRENGASQPWKGRVYLNPPFGKWEEFAPKVEKVLGTKEPEPVSELLCLVGTQTVTSKYFIEGVLRRASSVCVIQGRLKFWGSWTKNSRPPSGHEILYFGPRKDEFFAAFSHLGIVMDIRQPRELTASQTQGCSPISGTTEGCNP